jgi:hypothetical protein
LFYKFSQAIFTKSDALKIATMPFDSANAQYWSHGFYRNIIHHYQVACAKGQRINIKSNNNKICVPNNFSFCPELDPKVVFRNLIDGYSIAQVCWHAIMFGNAILGLG